MPTNAVFQVTFDEPMDVSTVLSQTTAFLYDYGSGIYRTGTGSMSSDGLTYTFVPNGLLAVNHQHSINMSLGFDLAETSRSDTACSSPRPSPATRRRRRSRR